MKQWLRYVRLIPLAAVNWVRHWSRLRRGVLLALAALAVLGGTALLLWPEASDPIDIHEPAEETAEAPSVSATPIPTRTVTMTFAGDCTLGMDRSFSYDGSFNACYDQMGAAYFLKNVRDIFAEDDLTVVNLEGALTESTAREDKTWAFKGSAEYTEVLTEGGVEAVNLANNHSGDYGETGFADTIAALDRADIAHFGFGETALLEIGGVKVGLLGMYTVYEDPDYIPQLRDAITSLQDQGAEIIVASFHWGLEYDDTPEEDQVELAHAAIDAGAHLVIGHHPHVLQGVEVYRGRYIVYSLGNFCFGGNYNPQDYDCMIFQQTFTVADGVVSDGGVQVIPCSLSSVSGSNNYQPTPASGEERTRIWKKLRQRSQGLGTRNIFDDT